MTHDYRREQTIDADPARLYDFVSDVANLPQYFARMRSAELVGQEEVRTRAVVEIPDQGTREVEGTAWFRRDEQARRIEWGSEGDNAYHGGLTVSGGDDGTSRVTIEIHTESGHDGIDEAIDETLATLQSVAPNA